MKITLTKTEYDALSDDAKKEYSADGDSFNLKLEDEAGKDLGSLRSAKDHEKKRRHDAEKLVKDLEKANEALEDKVHDLETGVGDDLKATKEDLQKRYDDKLARETGKLQKEVDRRDSEMKRLLVDNVASDIAGRISTVPTAMNRLVRDRLSVDWDGDELKTVVLGEDGKPSSLTVADLEKEFVSNSEFSGIIKGSQASGGGAGQGDNKGGGAFDLADYRNEDSTVNWSKVAKAEEATPGVLGKVKEAINS